MKDYLLKRIAGLTDGEAQIAKQIDQLRANSIATRAALDEAREMLKELERLTPPDGPKAP